MSYSGEKLGDPRVSIIIPSRDGSRDGCVARLLESIRAQSYSDYDIHLVEGVFPQGRAINDGVRQSTGSIIVILDDDSRLADGEVLARLVRSLDEDARIGMAGASIVLAPEASAFQKRAAAQFPRFATPEVDVVADSDLACHGCCALPRRVFDQVGGEREDIVRGLDPDLRVRIRAAGYRVVLAPNACIHHPLPDGIVKLLRIFFRNGVGSAYAQKFRPETVYETHEVLDATAFQPRTRLIYRLARFPLRLLAAMVRGQWLRLFAYSAYAFGYLWGLGTAREISTGIHESEAA